MNGLSRVLIITHNYLGDILMTMPLAYNIKKAYPNAVVAMCVGKRGRAVTSLASGIDLFIIRENYDRFWNIGRVKKEIRAFAPDMVIDLRNSYWTHRLAKVSGAARILTVGSPSRVRGLQTEYVQIENNMHLSDRALAAGVYMKLPSYTHAMSFQETACPDPHKSIVFLPGTTRPTKMWPGEYWEKLGKKLHAMTGQKILVLGAKDDAWLSDYFSDTRVFDERIGKTSLTELYCLLRHASFIITVDNGAMHIADYCDVPGVVLFGPTDWRYAGPKNRLLKVVEPDYTCKKRYCNEMKCNERTLCMTAISVDIVYETVSAMLLNE